MSRENVEVVRRMLDAFNDGDVEGVVATFDPECDLREPPEMPDRPATGFHGHDGIREWMANLRAVAGAEFEPLSFTTTADVVVVEMTGRGQGQASGAPFEWTTYAVFEVRGGRINRTQAFLTRDEAREAAGLVD